MGLFPPRSAKSQPGTSRSTPSASQDSEARTLTPEHETLSKSQIKRATRTRKIFSILTSLFLFISVVFIVMVEIGNTYDKPVLRNIWFINLNLSNIVPTSVPNSVLLNSIARTLGLHDFYQVGLWNYCEGYNDEGVTSCSSPILLYWFNPLDIIVDQLVAGATITLPSEITNVLNIIHIASRWMFVLFLTGACLSTVLMFVVLLSVYSRWLAFAVAVLTFFNALFITAASIVATVMFIIMRNVFETNTDVNIGATIGVTMFALMWVASAFAIFAFLLQLGMSCCCASRRDVKRGKKRGSKEAYAEDGMYEKPAGRRGLFGRRSGTD